MLKCHTSLRFPAHYYCYLTNQIFLIKEDKVVLVDKEDRITNTVIERYKNKEITDTILLLKLKYLVNDYLLNTITNYSNSIKQLTELHKDLNNGDVY